MHDNHTNNISSLPRPAAERPVNHAPENFVDLGHDSTYPRTGRDYKILCDPRGQYPVDLRDWPVRVGSERQLLIDDTLIAHGHNLRWTVHQPVKHADNPIIVPKWQVADVVSLDTRGVSYAKRGRFQNRHVPGRV